MNTIPVGAAEGKTAAMALGQSSLWYLTFRIAAVVPPAAPTHTAAFGRHSADSLNRCDRAFPLNEHNPCRSRRRHDGRDVGVSDRAIATDPTAFAAVVPSGVCYKIGGGQKRPAANRYRTASTIHIEQSDFTNAPLIRVQPLPGLVWAQIVVCCPCHQ